MIGYLQPLDAFSGLLELTAFPQII